MFIKVCIPNGNSQKRRVVQVNVLEEPVRREHRRGNNAEVVKRLAALAIGYRG